MYIYIKNDYLKEIHKTAGMLFKIMEKKLQQGCKQFFCLFGAVVVLWVFRDHA